MPWCFGMFVSSSSPARRAGPDLLRDRPPPHPGPHLRPGHRQLTQIKLALAKVGGSISAMIEAFSEQLIAIDELRARMPDLRR
jgi:hypothetical protein